MKFIVVLHTNVIHVDLKQAGKNTLKFRRKSIIKYTIFCNNWIELISSYFYIDRLFQNIPWNFQLHCHCGHFIVTSNRMAFEFLKKTNSDLYFICLLFFQMIVI